MSRLWRFRSEWLLTGFKPSPHTQIQDTCLPKECAAELKATQSHALVSTEHNVSIESILGPTRFSTLVRLIGVTTMILRAARRFKNAKRAGQPPVDAVEECKRAETLWVKCAKGSLSDMRSVTKQFNLFQDEQDVWRCGGLLANTEVSFEAKFPILLPKSHYLSYLVVKQAHE